MNNIENTLIQIQVLAHAIGAFAESSNKAIKLGRGDGQVTVDLGANLREFNDNIHSLSCVIADLANDLDLDEVEGE